MPLTQEEIVMKLVHSQQVTKHLFFSFFILGLQLFESVIRLMK